MTALPYPKVHIVISPAAGQDEPILNVLNDVFHPAGVEWEHSLTHKSSDKNAIGRRGRGLRGLSGSRLWW